jgi:hypothetical protein
MAEYEDREHFIPLRKSDLVQLLCKDKRLTLQEREAFRQFCLLVSHVFHFEYLQQLEALKDDYSPFDPDADTKPLSPLVSDERHKRQDQLFEKFSALMERGNFKHFAPDEVRATLQGLKSEFGISTDVDLNLFERLEMFARGDVVSKRTRRNWWTFWKQEDIHVPLYQRLVIIAKLRPSRRLDKDINTDSIYLKILKNIPKKDLDMLLPGARVRLSRMDKALIIYPLLTGVGVMLWKIAQTVGGQVVGGVMAAGGTVGFAWWSIAGALGGYGYKSYHSYQIKKQNYNLRLTKSLYYQSLDNNTGVLMRVLDEAEEQECRETFLAYFCLLKYAPAEGWSSEQLDDYVEMYLEGNANLKVDFEIGDALAKLERLKIVEKVGKAYRARPLDKALEMLDWTWDNYFKYNNPEPEEPPIP